MDEYHVIAGKFDDDGMNCKYSNSFATLEQALDDYTEHCHAPWAYIQYKGITLDVLYDFSLEF